MTFRFKWPTSQNAIKLLQKKKICLKCYCMMLYHQLNKLILTYRSQLIYSKLKVNNSKWHHRELQHSALKARICPAHDHQNWFPKCNNWINGVTNKFAVLDHVSLHFCLPQIFRLNSRRNDTSEIFFLKSDGSGERFGKK